MKPVGRRRGVLFIGYAEGNLGLGEAFRRHLMAATQAGLSFGVYPFQVGVETRRIGPFMPERYDRANAYDINVIAVAPDQVPVVFKSLDRRLTDNSYNILCTFWELPKAPEAWRSMLKGINEIWAPNHFVADAFTEIFSGPIVTVPPAINIGTGPYHDRKFYGMDSGRFYFLFNFDYFSSPYRKNPIGLLKAFQQAFPEGTENVGLVIKSVGDVEHFSDIKGAVLKAAQADPRIIIMDKNLSRMEMLGLINSADAYISLHRSEGFGAGMAEAMSFGKIVIGTNFSGNTDFLTEETGFPVPYSLRAVELHEYAWMDGQAWAEPNLDSAAILMQHVVANPDDARHRAEAGKVLVRNKYGNESVGFAIKHRLGELARRNELGGNGKTA